MNTRQNPTVSISYPMNHRLFNILTIVFILFAIFLTGGCGSGDPETTRETYGVGVMSGYQVNDADRDRSFDAYIWYPAADVESGTDEAVENATLVTTPGELPLIVYSHGLGGSATGMEFLSIHLASCGYIVIAPNFPHTNVANYGNFILDDVLNQPGDVSFMIDAALDVNDQFPSQFSGRIDSDRIGLVGYSYGGLTTYLAAFDRELRESRVKAAVSVAGAGGDFFDPLFFDFAEVPLMLVYGNADALIEYESVGLNAYENANAPKLLVTLEGGSHMGMGTSMEGMPVSGNPDTMACDFVSSVNYDEVTFYDQLNARVPDTGIGEYTAPLPCTYGAENEEAMTISRQHALVETVVLAFMDAHLSEDTDRQDEAWQLLTVAFNNDNSDAAIRYELPE